MDNKVSKLVSLFILVAIIAAMAVTGCQTTTKVNKVATPVITPAGGLYNGPQTVTITCATAGAEIRYTLDGTDPTENSIAYTEPFTAELGALVKAMAFKSGYEDSEIAVAHYEAYYPVIIGNCPIEGTADKMVICGDYAYVIGSYAGITAVNISNKRNPILAAQHSLPTKPEYIAISGNTIFVTQLLSGQREVVSTNLLAIDASNPLALQVIDTISWEGDYSIFTVEGSHAYLISEQQLKVVDISNPSALYEVGNCVARNTALKGIGANSNSVYVIADSQGYSSCFTRYDITDPGNPRSVSESCYIDLSDIYVEEDYLYLARERYGLSIFDISDPTKMKYLATCGSSRYLTKASHFIFMVNNAWDLAVVDIADPAQPQLIHTLPIPGRTKDLCVQDSYLLLADGEMGVQIFYMDMLDEQNPPPAKHKSLARNMIK